MSEGAGAGAGAAAAAAAPRPVPHFGFLGEPPHGPRYPLLTVDASTRDQAGIGRNLTRIYDETKITVTTRWLTDKKRDCNIDFDLQFHWLENDENRTTELCLYLSVAEAEVSKGAHWTLKVKPLATDAQVQALAEAKGTNVLCLRDLLPDKIEFAPDGYSWYQGRVCDGVNGRRYVAARYLVASARILKELFPTVPRIALVNEYPITDDLPSDDNYLRMFVRAMGEIAEENKWPETAEEERSSADDSVRPTEEDLELYDEMAAALRDDNDGGDDYVVPDEVLNERVDDWLAHGYAITNAKHWDNWTSLAMERVAGKLSAGHYWRHLYYAEKLGGRGIDVGTVKNKQEALRKALMDKKNKMSYFASFLEEIKNHLSSRKFREWVNACRLPEDDDGREGKINASEMDWRAWGKNHGGHLSYPSGFNELLPRYWRRTARGNPSEGQMHAVFKHYQEDYFFDMVFKDAQDEASECAATIKLELPGLELESLTVEGSAEWTHPRDTNDPRMYPQVQGAQAC